jgi:hypothetical protein
VRWTTSRLLLPVVLAGLIAALETAAGAGVPAPPTPVDQASPRVLTSADRRIVDRIIAARDSTWHWQTVMLRRRTSYAATAERPGTTREYRRWVLGVWERRAKEAWREARHPPHYEDWLCIHRYEGSWTDPDGPYYGGLQMDLSFQRAYGASLLDEKGTADRWSPLEQMWVAEKAHASGRGFYPWPNTARFCGLL